MDKKQLMKQLKEFKKKIEKNFSVEKLIFFGSRANGKYRKDSDVDLIVVGGFKDKGNLKRAPPLYLAWDIDLPVDFLCYTPEEFNKLKKMVTIAREAARKGIVIK